MVWLNNIKLNYSHLVRGDRREKEGKEIERKKGGGKKRKSEK